MTDSTPTTPPANAADAAQPRRPRGTGFPSLTITEAVALIRQIAGFGAVHNNASLASALGHTTANSGPYRSKIAALKDYGLLTGRNDELTVTQLAQEIANPGFDADPQADLRKAFEQCQLFMTVLGELGKNQNLAVSSLANHAMNRHGVSNQSKDSFAEIFVKSGEVVGLIEVVDAEHFKIVEPSQRTVEQPAGDVDGAVPGVDTATSANVGGPGQPPAARQQFSAPSNAVVNHSWPIEGGVIRFTIETSMTLPATAYAVVGTVINEGDKLAALLAPAPVSPTVQAEPEQGDSADSE